MLVPHNVNVIINRVSRGSKLQIVLRELNISPLEFFKYLDSNPDDKLNFERARQIAIEMVLDEVPDLIKNVRSNLDYDKAKLSIQSAQWFAEKLIPKTYGTRVDHNLNMSINLIQVLDEAKARVQIDSTVVETKSREVQERDLLGD